MLLDASNRQCLLDTLKFRAKTDPWILPRGEIDRPIWTHTDRLDWLADNYPPTHWMFTIYNLNLKISPKQTRTLYIPVDCFRKQPFLIPQIEVQLKLFLDLHNSIRTWNFFSLINEKSLLRRVYSDHQPRERLAGQSIWHNSNFEFQSTTLNWIEKIQIEA